MNKTQNPRNHINLSAALVAALIAIVALLTFAPTPSSAGAIGDPVPVAPNNNTKVQSDRPTFSFLANTRANVTYELAVFDANGVELASERFKLDEAKCNNWGYCTAPVDIVLDNGRFSWDIHRTMVRSGQVKDFVIWGVDSAMTPISPKNSEIAPGSVTFSWTRAAGVIDYTVLVYNADGSFSSTAVSAHDADCSYSSTCWTAIEVVDGDESWSVVGETLDGTRVSSDWESFETTSTTTGNSDDGSSGDDDSSDDDAVGSDDEDTTEQDDAEEAEPLDPATPEAPTGLSTDDTPTFVWTEVEDADDYRITITDEDDDVTYLYATSADCNSGKCQIDSGAMADGGYRFTVWAGNLESDSGESEALDFAIGRSLPEPEIVSPAVATETGTVAPGSVTLTWKPSEGTVEYLHFLEVAGGDEIELEVTPDQAGCAGATGQCTYEVALTDTGRYNWTVTAAPDAINHPTLAYSSDEEAFDVVAS